MSSLSTRGGRGRGRGGYRPKRRPVVDEPPVTNENSSKVKVDADPTVLPPAENIPSPTAQPPRKPFNVFNIPKQPMVMEMETSKLYEKFKCTPPSQNSDKKKKNDDEDDDDDEKRCEFCAKDHPTRFCTIFEMNKNSVPQTPANACYYCKQPGHYKQQCPKKMVRDRANTSGGNADRRNNFRGHSENFGGNRQTGAASSNSGQAGTDSQKGGGNWSSVPGNPRPTARQAGQPQKKIVVPMPVPASSIKPVVQLRSKLKANATSEPAVAVKSVSRDVYCRSDTDDFSSSDSDEIDGNSSVPSSSAIGGANLGDNQENSSNKSESRTRQTPPVKAKFDLSSIDLTGDSDKKPSAPLKSQYTPPSLLAVHRSSGQRHLKLSDILYPQKSPSEPAKPCKVDETVVNDSASKPLEDNDSNNNDQVDENGSQKEQKIVESDKATEKIESSAENIEPLVEEKVVNDIIEPSAEKTEPSTEKTEPPAEKIDSSSETIECSVEKDKSLTDKSQIELESSLLEKSLDEDKESEVDDVEEKEDELDLADVQYSVDFDSDSVEYDEKSEADGADGAFLDDDDSELEKEIAAIVEEIQLEDGEEAVSEEEGEPCCSSSIFKPTPVKPPPLILQPVGSDDEDENAGNNERIN